MSHKNRRRNRTVAWVIVMVIAMGCSSPNAPGDHNPSDPVHVSKCLTDHGAQLYGANWCPYTSMQIAEFGDAISNIHYVECTADPATCAGAGISSYPTWIVEGRRYMGYRTVAELAAIIGCGQ